MELVTALENSYRGIMAGKDLTGARIGETEKAWARDIVAENLFTNPRLVGDGTWGEVRRNVAINPLMEVSSTTVPSSNQPAVAPITRAVDVPVPHPLGIAKATRQEWLDGTNLLTMYNLDRPGGDAPQRMLGCWVLITEAGYRIGTIGGYFPQVDLPANQWVFLRTTSPVAEGGFASISAYKVEGLPSTTARAYVTGVVSEAGDRPVSGYWDGNTTPETAGDIVQPKDFRWRWLGAENASESVMEIERVRGLTATNCVAGVSTKAGGAAVRLIPLSNSTISFASFPISSAARASGTFAATSHLDAPLPSPLDRRRGSIDVSSPQTDGPYRVNTAGAAALRQIFSAQSTFAMARMWRGGTQGSGDVWWTDIGLFAGDYDGEVFSGDTPDYGRDTYTWAGEENNSTSIKTSWL